MRNIKVDKTFSTEFIIKKSKFITFIKKVESKSEINSFINECNQKNARHNCYAFSYLENNIQHQGYDNDGEPIGTSGDVLLNFIKINNLENICIYVIRYFGGIKLGTGLLTRSYIQGAKFLINNTIEFEKIYNFLKIIKVGIENQNKVNAFLNKNQFINFERIFEADFVKFVIKSDQEIITDDIQNWII